MKANKNLYNLNIIWHGKTRNKILDSLVTWILKTILKKEVSLAKNLVGRGFRIFLGGGVVNFLAEFLFRFEKLWRMAKNY